MESVMKRLDTHSFAGRWLLIAGGAVAVLLAGCPSRGGGSPERTFETAQDYIRNGEYRKVWTLYTERFQREIVRDTEKQKESARKWLATGGPNVTEVAKFTEDQFGLDLRQFVDTPVRDLRARILERRREQALKMHPDGPARIDGDRATMTVAGTISGNPETWTFRRQNGKWLIDTAGTPTRQE
jgi:hypothetical protein